MYMYPIKIKREPQKIYYTREIELEKECLTLAELRQYNVTEDETFSIGEVYEAQFPTPVLCISGWRVETTEEMNERVAKEEKYMENYAKFHANKKK